MSLRKIVTESLIAFPEDAHLRVVAFLKEAGATDAEKTKVQQAWSAVALGSEAFGRKKAPIDPVLFGDELIRELAAGDKEIARLEGLISNFQTVIAESSTAQPAQLSSLADLKKPSGALASLQSMTRIGKELTAALNATYEAPASSSSSSNSNSSQTQHQQQQQQQQQHPAVHADTSDRAIMEWRRMCRGGKFIWHGRKATQASPLYCPLGSVELGGVEVLYGEVAYKNVDSHKDASRPSAIPMVGVKVITKQPSLLSRAWVSYHCLHEIANERNPHLQLFGLPYGVQRDAGAGAGTALSASSVLCAFELPHCRPLSQLLSPALATFLRRYPSVALTWCAQLGVAAANLLRCTSGCLVRSPTVKDCFVKENGQLMVGNVAFESTAGEEGDADRSTTSSSSSSNDISEFAVQVLATSLALSRKHEAHLSPSLLENNENDDLNTRPNNSNSSSSSSSSSSSDKEDVVSVMEGCELQIVFTGHACRGVTLELLGGKVEKGSSSSTAAAAAAAAAVSGTRLNVLVQGEASVATLVASTASSSRTYVTVKANSAGLLLLHAVSPAHALVQEKAGTSSSAAAAAAGRLAAAVRIVVVPAYPVMATELQEVISLADAALSAKSNKFVMSAQAVVNQCPLTHDEASVARDWASVSRSVLDIIDPAGSLSFRPPAGTGISSPSKTRATKAHKF